jgi:hypothetical protein
MNDYDEDDPDEYLAMKDGETFSFCIISEARGITL